jgi:hypothetical protein
VTSLVPAVVREKALAVGAARWLVLLAQQVLRFSSPVAVAASTLAADLDTVRDDLAGVVQAALEPAHLALWTAPRE